MYEHVRYDLLADADGEESQPALEDKTSSFLENEPEQAFNFDSAFKYDAGVNDSKYRTDTNYNSAFKYSDDSHSREEKRSQSVVLNMSSEGEKFTAQDSRRVHSSCAVAITCWILTFLSYLFFIITSPVTYFIFVKKLGEFDRLVVFRLGKMIGVKGPGRVIVFPWMDKTKQIDVRATAFAVPPQQFITWDGGIVEMGADIQYCINDVITMASEVADHQDILRSLGKTILVKILVKKTVSQIDKDTRVSAQKIQDELNNQVRKWGIDVQKVDLSTAKILKHPDSGSTTAVGSILKGLGVARDKEYLTPQDVVRASHGLSDQNCPLSSTAKSSKENENMMECITPSQAEKGKNMNYSLLQMMSSVSAGLTHPSTSKPNYSHDVTANSAETSSDWGKRLEDILQSDFKDGTTIDDDAQGLYKLEILNDKDATKSIYYIEMNAINRCIRKEISSEQMLDISVTISSDDLTSILDGSLSPLHAYLTGRITVDGDVRKLMLLNKISERSHKQGTMFNV